MANLAEYERIGQGMETGRLVRTVVEKSRASEQEPLSDEKTVEWSPR